MSAKYFTVKAGGQYISNEVIYNQNLSMDALGLFLVMLARPAQARQDRDTLCKVVKNRGMGRRRVQAALQELEVNNYRFRIRYRDPRGLWLTSVLLFESPQTPDQALEEFRKLIPDASVFEVVTNSNLADREDCGESETLASAAVGTASKATQSYPQDTSGGDVSAGRTDRPVPVPRKNKPVDNSENGVGQPLDETAASGLDCSVSAGRTDRPVCACRKCSQYISKDISKIDKSITIQPIDQESNLPMVAEVSSSEVGKDSLVGGGEIQDWLPGHWVSILPPSARKPLMVLLDQAAGNGWNPASLKELLASQPLPGDAKNLPGLILWRVKTLAETPPWAPAQVLSQTQQAVKETLTSIIDGTTTWSEHRTRYYVQGLTKQILENTEIAQLKVEAIQALDSQLKARHEAAKLLLETPGRNLEQAISDVKVILCDPSLEDLHEIANLRLQELKDQLVSEAEEFLEALNTDTAVIDEALIRKLTALWFQPHLAGKLLPLLENATLKVEASIGEKLKIPARWRFKTSFDAENLKTIPDRLKPRIENNS